MEEDRERKVEAPRKRGRCDGGTGRFRADVTASVKTPMPSPTAQVVETKTMVCRRVSRRTRQSARLAEVAGASQADWRTITGVLLAGVWDDRNANERGLPDVHAVPDAAVPQPMVVAGVPAPTGFSAYVTPTRCGRRRWSVGWRRRTRPLRALGLQRSRAAASAPDRRRPF